MHLLFVSMILLFNRLCLLISINCMSVFVGYNVVCSYIEILYYAETCANSDLICLNVCAIWCHKLVVHLALPANRYQTVQSAV